MEAANTDGCGPYQWRRQKKPLLTLQKNERNYPLEKVKYLPEDFFIHPDHKVVFHQGNLWFTLLSPSLTGHHSVFMQEKKERYFCLPSCQYVRSGSRTFCY
jgi:hypothetical protein